MVKDTDFIDAALSSDYLVEFDKGDVIFKEGDAGAEMFIVRTGVVEVAKVTGGRERRLTLLGEGDFFGEGSVLDKTPRNVTVKASTHCQLLKLDREEFDLIVQVNPDVALNMVRRMSRNLARSLEAHATTGGSAIGDTQPIPVFGRSASAHRPRLVHEVTGIEFDLAESSETRVGRPDPQSGHMPDIDLSSVEEQPSTSRDHARISRRKKRFFVHEESPSTNGSFVNDKRVEPGSPVEIKSGDAVQFGLVKLQFVV